MQERTLNIKTFMKSLVDDCHMEESAWSVLMHKLKLKDLSGGRGENGLKSKAFLDLEVPGMWPRNSHL